MPEAQQDPRDSDELVLDLSSSDSSISPPDDVTKSVAKNSKPATRATRVKPVQNALNFRLEVINNDKQIGMVLTSLQFPDTVKNQILTKLSDAQVPSLRISLKLGDIHPTGELRLAGAEIIEKYGFGNVESIALVRVPGNPNKWMLHPGYVTEKYFLESAIEGKIDAWGEPAVELHVIETDPEFPSWYRDVVSFFEQNQNLLKDHNPSITLTSSNPQNRKK